MARRREICGPFHFHRLQDRTVHLYLADRLEIVNQARRRPACPIESACRRAGRHAPALLRMRNTSNSVNRHFSKRFRSAAAHRTLNCRVLYDSFPNSNSLLRRPAFAGYACAGLSHVAGSIQAMSGRVWMRKRSIAATLAKHRLTSQRPMHDAGVSLLSKSLEPLSFPVASNWRNRIRNS